MASADYGVKLFTGQRITMPDASYLALDPCLVFVAWIVVRHVVQANAWR
jgi:hypothetical protein